MLKNPSIGTCPCPIPKCGETCRVSKFKASHQRDAGRRLAGKLYIDCPKHGRMGMDGKAEMQTWILENATLPRDAVEATPIPSTPATPAAAPRHEPARAEEKPKPAPAPAAAKRSGWGFFDG